MNNGTKQNLGVRWCDNPKEYHRLYGIAHRTRPRRVNRELARERDRRWRIKAIENDPEFRKKKCAGVIAHYHKDLAKSRALNRVNNAKRKYYALRYRQQNRERLQEWHRNNRKTEAYRMAGRLATAKRRAYMRNAVVGDPKEIKKYYRSVRENLLVVCFYCNDVFNSKLAHVDHVVPLSRGGQHSVTNFCVSCPKCNLSKNDKLVEEWKPNFTKKVGAS